MSGGEGMPLRRLVARDRAERRLIDVSPPISPRTDVWPGDTRFSSRRVMDLAAGASCNVTTIETTVQIGAHADAPLHFAAGAPDAATVDLHPYVGPARVVRMPRSVGITRTDVEALDLVGVERLLLHTRGARTRVRFADPFAWLEPEAATYLGENGLRLLGIDTFSVDRPDSRTLESHHALLRGGCLILEGLDLSGVAPGDYELLALPLRLEGCDASPVRAVLRELPPTGPKRGLPRRDRARVDVRSRGGDAPPAADGARIRRSEGAVMDKNCLHSRLNLAEGDRVRVTLDGAANVMLIDDDNFDLWETGEPFQYAGGWATRSPVEIPAPRTGAWNVVIDQGKAGAAVAAAVQVLR